MKLHSDLSDHSGFTHYMYIYDMHELSHTRLNSTAVVSDLAVKPFGMCVQLNASVTTLLQLLQSQHIT